MKHHVPQTLNLQADGMAAARMKVPLLLVFSQEHCEFCQLLKEEIIEPMLISGDYANRVIIREFMIDDAGPATDFRGNQIEPYDIFHDYDMFVTPTVIVVDWHGRELAERMVGINTVDYYGYYLDEAIELALSKIR